MTRPKDAERAHCEAVAREVTKIVDANPCYTQTMVEVVARERAAARDAALADALQAFGIYSGYHPCHIVEERIRALKGKVTP